MCSCKKLSASIFALFVSGCAGVSGSSISSKETDDWVSGIRYYEQAPFLLVYSDGKNGLTADVKYLPDTTRKRSLKPYSIMATNNSSFEFTDGALTKSTSDVDTQVVPKAVIEAIKNVAIEAAPLLFDDAQIASGQIPETKELPPPRIYRIVAKADGSVALRGGRTLKSDGLTEVTKGIEVTILAAPAAGK